MSIRPIDFNGMVQRTQDVSTLKQNEDNRPAFQQQMLATKQQKDTRHHMQQVSHSEDTQNYQKKYDAREKGSNEYQKNSGNKDRKKEKKDGKVIPKSSLGGFDMKV